MPTLKKEVVEDVNVYEASKERFRLLYDRFDKVCVAFSGGKDSTVVLNVAIEIAKEKNKLPVDVVFFDEEAIHPETISYCERVSKLPEVNFLWLCIPVKHRNACSRQEPYWYCWDKDKEDKWCRPMPEQAVTEVKGFVKGMGMVEMVHLVYDESHGTVAMARGIRADESLRRYRSVAHRTKDNWIAKAERGYFYQTSPIYDWTTFDVWTAPRKFNWDYNRAYDVMQKMGVNPNKQRVCPPYGEEPLGGLWIYAQAWPDLWHKMIGRVHGAATAGRYANTELYGFGRVECPKGITWKEWTFRLINLYPEDLRKVVAKNVADLMKFHKSKTHASIPEEEPDRITGLSWKFLAMIANRGDLKARRARMVTSKASQKFGNEDLATALGELDEGTRY